VRDPVQRSCDTGATKRAEHSLNNTATRMGNEQFTASKSAGMHVGGENIILIPLSLAKTQCLSDKAESMAWLSNTATEIVLKSVYGRDGRRKGSSACSSRCSSCIFQSVDSGSLGGVIETAPIKSAFAANAQHKKTPVDNKCYY